MNVLIDNKLSCRIEGEIDEAALAESFQRIVSHHPILRTSYHWEGLERSLQVVRSIVPTQLQREDWVVSGSSRASSTRIGLSASSTNMLGGIRSRQASPVAR